jgi:hypothetical protein
MTLIVVPSVVSLINKDFEISVFLDANEEESKSFETDKTLELIADNFNNSSDSFKEITRSMPISYRFKTYAKAHLNLISPPPELHML